MNQRGVSLPVIAVIIFIIGVVAIAGIFLWRSASDSVTVGATSDRGNLQASFRIAGDPWIGYLPIASDYLQNVLRRNNISLTYVSDGGDYATRMEQLRTGDIDFAVATVSANMLNTRDFNRGGVIVAVIDQSNGGDAMVCDQSKITTIDDFTNKTGWSVAFTPNSPSHHLVRAVGNDFGIDAFLAEGNWRVEADGSADALERLQDGQVTCAVLWQPDVTKALKSKTNQIVYSTADADKLVVDILMVRRQHLLPSSPMREHVTTVLREYFNALRELNDDDALLLREAKTYLRTFDGGRYSDDEMRSMLTGVQWVNLRENAESWFGVGGKTPYFGLAEAHEAALSIIRAERGASFLARFQPASVMDSRIVRDLYAEGVINEANATITDPLKLRFPALSELMWNTLETQGTLRSRRIVFISGSTELDETSQVALGEAMSDFKKYPASRLEIQVGYLTNTQDVAAAQAAATERGAQVRQYLIDRYGLDPNRLRVYVPEPQDVAMVIPKRQGEGNRSYRSRLREARLVLRRPRQQ